MDFSLVFKFSQWREERSGGNLLSSGHKVWQRQQLSLLPSQTASGILHSLPFLQGNSNSAKFPPGQMQLLTWGHGEVLTGQ